MIGAADHRNQFWLSKYITPASLTLVLLAFLIGGVIWSSGGDSLELARLGTRYNQGTPGGTEGYDGQFVYYIARDPGPLRVAQYLDVPAYRYQRILMPLLARAVSLGNQTLLPWSLVAIGVVSQVIGTWLLENLLVGWGLSRWYALVYGLYAGFTLAIRLDLPEPLAFSLVIGAVLAGEKNFPRVGWLLYGLALFAKEVTAIFLAAALISALLQRRWRDLAGLTLLAVLPFALFQAWLWQVFGQPGIGAGGAMATSFEWVPFMGLWRIGSYSPAYLLAMLAVFAPAVILPTLWGLWVSIRQLIDKHTTVVVLALFLNALVIPFLPFSTFRETGGLLRFSCGLALAVVLFAGSFRMKRVLNYSIFWLVLNVFLLKT